MAAGKEHKEMTRPTPPHLAEAREEFNELIESFRPNLHRYCARMTGSVVDAEDVVQDVLAKAFYLLPTTEVSNLQGWLLKIAHNKSIDYLRKKKNDLADPIDEYPLQAEIDPPLENKELATLALSIFLQLTPMQRSCVILMDVIGYSLAEISEMLDASVGAVKAALHRGRANLRMLSKTVDRETPPILQEPEASLLSAYVERFNAGDFEAVRAMLADDVRLDLVERAKAEGAGNVGRYFRNYSKLEHVHLALGFVESRPAILISDGDESSEIIYFVFLCWDHGKISLIRDYRYARHVMADAEITMLDQS